MSLNFTTTTNYVDAGNNSALQNINPITICAWIYPTGWGGSNYGRIIDKGDSNVFFVSNAGGSFGQEALVYYRTRTGTTTDFRSNNGSIVLNTWQHVAVTSDNSGTVLYINGQPVSSYVSSTVGTGSINNDSGTDLWVGNRADFARYFQGQMSDLRIYNVYHDANTIWTIYSSFGHDSVLGGLVLRYTFFDKPPGSTGNIFKGVNSNSVGSSNNVSVNVPTNNDGDALIAFVACGGDTGGTAPTVSTPTGWDLLSNVNAPSTFSTPSMYIFGRLASSEPASYNFVASQSNSIIAAIGVYDGNYISVVGPVSGTNSGTGTSPIAPSVNATGPSLVIRAMVGDDDTGIDDFPPGTIGRFTDSQGGTGNGVTFAFADQLVSSAGATGTATFDYGDNEQWGTITVAETAESSAIRDVSNNKFDGTGIEVSYSEDILSYRRRV